MKQHGKQVFSYWTFSLKPAWNLTSSSRSSGQIGHIYQDKRQTKAWIFLWKRRRAKGIRRDPCGFGCDGGIHRMSRTAMLEARRPIHQRLSHPGSCKYIGTKSWSWSWNRFWLSITYIMIIQRILIMNALQNSVTLLDNLIAVLFFLREWQG